MKWSKKPGPKTKGTANECTTCIKMPTASRFNKRVRRSKKIKRTNLLILTR